MSGQFNIQHRTLHEHAKLLMRFRTEFLRTTGPDESIKVGQVELTNAMGLLISPKSVPVV